jgi:sec-independent protein translocase protein TatC
LFYLIGSFLTYTVLLPYCWKFFSGFELNYENNGISIQLETRLYEYLNFFIEIFFSLNIILNFCLFLSFFLLKFPIGILIKLRKILYLFSFVVATLLTPPDILSQIVVGSALIGIYELFLFSMFLTKEYKKGE